MSWHGIKNAPSLEVTPQLPKISADGLVIFGFFFLSDLLLSQINSSINHRRLNHIQDNQKQTSGIASRNRTGREEIATLRKLSKEKLITFVDTLMATHDIHKELMKEMDYHKSLNMIDAHSPPFDHLSAYDAAVLMLRHKHHEQLMAQMATGAIGQFHHQVQKKSAALSVRMENIISS